MSDFKETQHGRNHLPRRSDPIWDEYPIFFNDLNDKTELRWLWIVTTDSIDIDYGELGLALVDRSGFGLYFRAENNGDFSYIQTEPTAIVIETADFGVISAGNILTLQDGGFAVDVGGTTKLIHLALTGSGVPIQYNQSLDGHSFRLQTGTSFEILNDAGTPILTVDEDGTITPSGGGGDVATDTIWNGAGDLAVGTGSDTAARLALGATGTVLVSNGTTAVWGDIDGGSP